MGYSHIKENNSLNIFTSDLSKMNSSSFAKSAYTYFGSCRTGNLFNRISFAQEWANMSGGSVKAATGTEYNNGRTYYGNIYEENIFYKAIGKLGGSTPRSKARANYGFSTTGCYHYPIVNDGGSFKKYASNIK